jgi:Peptidase family M28
VSFVVVAPAILAFLFSISTTGTLQRSSLEPLFNGESAAALATTLDTEFPSRVPGSEGADDATLWYAQSVGALGLTTVTDTWTDDIADLGAVQLSNVVTTVPGRSDETIVVVAHRDNAGTDQALGDNASGTGALLELARGFAPQNVGPDPLPQHTFVFVSTDAGAYGGAGADRFAETSPLARSAIAVVVLDGIGGRGRPRIAIAGDAPVSPARVLVRTAARRVEERVGVAPALPAAPLQLLDLGMPYAAGEQGRFLGHGIAAVTLMTTDRDHPPVPAGDPDAGLDTQRLGQLGRSTEALLSSLDASVGGAFHTPDSLFLGDRAASGWTVRLALILLVVPFALGVVDLIVRSRRRGLPFRPALRALRARVGMVLIGGGLLWLGMLTGVFPTGAPLPLAPYADVLDNPPVAGLLLLAGAYAVLWLIARQRLVIVAPPTAEEWLAGLAVALALVGVVAVVVALTKPYALVFVIPSLYAWLALPVEGPLWRRIILFVVGLSGPMVAFALLGSELGISVPAAIVYTLGLATVGYLPLGTVVVVLLWLAGAIQVGALAFGRYGPYAGGAEPPPPGPARQTLRRVVSRG